MTDEPQASAAEWTRCFFKGADSGDPAFFTQLVDPNIRLIVGHNEAVVGKDNLQAAYQAVSEILVSIQHNVVDVLVSTDDASADQVIAAELSIDYKLKNGSELTLPCVNLLKVRGGKAVEQKVFMDAAPLFAAAAK